MIIKNPQNSAKITGNDGAIIYDLINPQHVKNGIRYSLAYVKLPHGKSTLSHMMKTSEVYYILEGEGVLHINNEFNHVKTGDAIFVFPGSKQHMDNAGSGDLKFLCIVDPAWEKDDETIL